MLTFVVGGCVLVGVGAREGCESVIGVVDVDICSVEVGIGSGEIAVRWLKTKYPAIPASITTPMITMIFINPLWFIYKITKLEMANYYCITE